MTEGGGGLGRREFLKRSSLGASALALAAGTGGAPSPAFAAEPVRPVPPSRKRSADVVVVGAGVFGLWTALRLQESGVQVTLVDQYGPGNSRATSGGETRGIRTSYPGNELWTRWAGRAIERWIEFDDQWAESMGGPVFFQTGDLILRPEGDAFIAGVREVWDATATPYEVLSPEEVRRRWPALDVQGMASALYEPGAGVGRARAACQRVGALFERLGGEIRIGKAVPQAGGGGRLSSLQLEGAEAVGADRYVFALGPWFPKVFPALMADRMRIPMGHVYYFGTPPGDTRFTHPNLPSWNVPGVTGWPSLPPDHRGFRIRTGGRPGEDPDTSSRVIPEESLAQPLRILEERFPGLLGQPIVETRACHYESTTSRNWIIDRHPDWENVWLAGGGNAEGFKFGPVLGDLIADRVMENQVFAELTSLFRLDSLPG